MVRWNCEYLDKNGKLLLSVKRCVLWKSTAELVQLPCIIHNTVVPLVSSFVLLSPEGVGNCYCYLWNVEKSSQLHYIGVVYFHCQISPTRAGQKSSYDLFFGRGEIWKEGRWWARGHMGLGISLHLCATPLLTRHDVQMVVNPKICVCATWRICQCSWLQRTAAAGTLLKHPLYHRIIWHAEVTQSCTVFNLI